MNYIFLLKNNKLFLINLLFNLLVEKINLISLLKFNKLIKIDKIILNKKKISCIKTVLNNKNVKYNNIKFYENIVR